MKITDLRLSTLLIMSLLLISCGGEKTSSREKQEVQQSPKEKMLKEIFAGLPESCSLMDGDFVSEVVGIPAENISVKPGGTSQTVPSKSCFYKWTGGELSNAGLMVQALGNPVPDEFPDWPFFFIDNKKSLGERSMSDPDKPSKFTTMQNMGDQACYNIELGKCYFRKDETVYMIALNGLSDPDKRMEVFTKVGNKIISQI